MNLIKAERLANELVSLHLIHLGYVFKYNNSPIALGRCSYTKRIIYLSRHWTSSVREEEVLDTILHEIAHALAGEKGCYNHGDIWQRIASKLGAKPEATANLEVDVTDVVSPKYQLIDTTTGQVLKNYYKRPSNRILRAARTYYIPSRKQETIGKLKIFAYVESDDLMDLI